MEIWFSSGLHGETSWSTSWSLASARLEVNLDRLNFIEMVLNKNHKDFIDSCIRMVLYGFRWGTGRSINISESNTHRRLIWTPQLTTASVPSVSRPSMRPLPSVSNVAKARQHASAVEKQSNNSKKARSHIAGDGQYSSQRWNSGPTI